MPAALKAIFPDALQILKFCYLRQHIDLAIGGPRRMSSRY